MNFIKQNWPVLLTLLAFIGILIYSIIKQDSRDIFVLNRRYFCNCVAFKGRLVKMELTIDNIIKLLETQGVGSKQIVLNLLKKADETQLTQLYQSVLLKLNEKRR